MEGRWSGRALKLDRDAQNQGDDDVKRPARMLLQAAPVGHGGRVSKNEPRGGAVGRFLVAGLLKSRPRLTRHFREQFGQRSFRGSARRRSAPLRLGPACMRSPNSPEAFVEGGQTVGDGRFGSVEGGTCMSAHPGAGPVRSALPPHRRPTRSCGQEPPDVRLLLKEAAQTRIPRIGRRSAILSAPPSRRPGEQRGRRPVRVLCRPCAAPLDTLRCVRARTRRPQEGGRYGGQSGRAPRPARRWPAPLRPSDRGRGGQGRWREVRPTPRWSGSLRTSGPWKRARP